MGSLNKVLLIGFLGQDPEKRVTSGGHSVVTVNLATTERFKDREGNKQERTEWHRLVFWNLKADLVEQYCKKGSQLYVEGSLQTREWLDKDGNKRYTTEIQVRNLEFLDRLPSGQGNHANNQHGGYQQPNQSAAQTSGSYQPPPAANNPAEPPVSQQSREPSTAASQPKVAPGTDDFIEDDIPF